MRSQCCLATTPPMTARSRLFCAPVSAGLRPEARAAVSGLSRSPAPQGATTGHWSHPLQEYQQCIMLIRSAGGKLPLGRMQTSHLCCQRSPWHVGMAAHRRPSGLPDTQPQLCVQIPCGMDHYYGRDESVYPEIKTAR